MSPAARPIATELGTVCVEFRIRAYSLRIQSLGHGDAFGWSALLEGHDTLFQVRAHEHSTAICLDGAYLVEVFREDQPGPPRCSAAPSIW